MEKRTCRNCKHVRAGDTIECDHPVFVHEMRIINWHDQDGYTHFGCDEHEFPGEEKHGGPGEAR